MFDYIKTTQRNFNPDIYILYVGTNDLPSHKSSEQICLDILNLDKSLKLNNNTIVVSNIFHRDYVYKKIADEVSANLEKLCRVNNIEVISHRNVIPKNYLNTGSLHYNDQFLLETLEIFEKKLTRHDAKISVTLLFIFLLCEVFCYFSA